MGCSVREKHIRTHRKTRSSKPEPAAAATKPENPKPGNRNPSQMPNPESETRWGCCSEEQLEQILLKNLHFLYNEAVNKLVELGYDEDLALKAVLRNGYCYGELDVLSNVLQNSLAYLRGGNGVSSNSEPVFVDLRQLGEYSLAGMVFMLRQAKPNLSRTDAMWCLLMSDLHVGRAGTMDIPVLPTGGGGSGCSCCPGGSVGGNAESGEGDGEGFGISPLCKFMSFLSSGAIPPELPLMEGMEGFLVEMEKEIECPKRFDLSPSMKGLLKRNVSMFAAGYRANAKQFHAAQMQACSSGGSVKSGSGVGDEVPAGKSEESQLGKNQDIVKSVMNKFRDLKLEEGAELNQKDQMLVSLVREINELEKQVKERKEWAHQKAMQAARKLSQDLTELKMLRMEKDEIQRLKKGKQTLEDSTLKRLSEMEGALRKASAQVDRANAAVRKLEGENAEIRAEMEASKLSASESVATSLEVAKREKKFLKKLLTWEKQKAKLQEDTAAERQKISELQLELAQVEAATKEAEEKWRQELKSKELALAHVEEERRLKEASEANNKRKLEVLRLKIELDFQRHKDDLQRLEHEYARLKESEKSVEGQDQYNLFTGKSDCPKTEGEIVSSLMHESNQLEDVPAEEAGYDRKCMICMKDEVSVVFLPCAHQVICANCNDNYAKKGRATCPCCRVPIEQRIRVFGATS